MTKSEERLPLTIHCSSATRLPILALTGSPG